MKASDKKDLKIRLAEMVAKALQFAPMHLPEGASTKVRYTEGETYVMLLVNTQGQGGPDAFTIKVSETI